MTDLTSTQRAVLLKLARNDAVTVTEAHQWWFKHLARSTVKTTVGRLVYLGLIRAAGVGDRNAPTYAATDEGRAVFATNTNTTEESK